MIDPVYEHDLDAIVRMNGSLDAAIADCVKWASYNDGPAGPGGLARADETEWFLKAADKLRARKARGRNR